ncbi:YheC/YheD family endospore coat-associated protein [Metabacillus arenae]|uniref:YheC/YheD family protein n=1 Tax=Metabacillus arenae TaxID=2771434 RepID=A0A926NFJ2_9BACI|nr:YheC/YheD family protein [Metabacillus arenae]MBD1383362.1 YheC/YheD family protein [Metabacillus arenae]
MITLGFLTVQAEHEIIYATKLAKRAADFGIKIIRFCPTDIEPASLSIEGRLYDSSKDQWVIKKTELPSFIYDRCFYQNNSLSPKSRPIVQWLKSNPNITFLGMGLPNKGEVYEAIKKHSTLSAYLPPTEKIANSIQIIDYLRKQEKCVLKPLNGSGGRGIILLELYSKKVDLTYHHGKNKQTKSFYSLKELESFCHSLMQKQSYLVQPLLQLKDSSGYPFDIRYLLQKNEHGKWTFKGDGVRRGYKGSFLSNLASGGEYISYQDWAATLTPFQKVVFEDEIKTILEELPPYLDKTFPSLFELGIDIGVSDDSCIWLLDINSKPGRQIILKNEAHKQKDEIYEAPLKYCRYLADKQETKDIRS